MREGLCDLRRAFEAGSLSLSELLERLDPSASEHRADQVELAAWLAERSERARALSDSDEHEQALALARGSLAIAERLDVPAVAALTAIELGLICEQRGAFFDATKAYERAFRALAGAEPAPPEVVELRVEARARWAQAALEDHRHDLALGLADEAIGEGGQPATGLTVTFARWIRARALAGRHRHDEALLELRKVVALRRELGQPPGSEALREILPSLTMVLIALGRALRDSGRFDEAIDRFHEAAAGEVAEASDDGSGAIAASEMAYTYQHLGREDLARPMFRDAARRAHTAGRHDLAARWRTQFALPAVGAPETPIAGPIDSPVTAYARSAVAERFYHEKRFEELLPLAEQLCSWAISARDEHLHTTTANLVGICLLEQRKYSESTVRFRESIEAGERANKDLMTLAPRANLAHAYRASGHAAAAVAVLERALSVAERLLHGAETGAMQQEVLATASTLYDDLIAILGESRENDFHVLRASELTRGRVLRGWIKAQQIAATASGTVPEEVATAIGELRRAEVEVELARSRQSAAVPADLLRRVNVNRDRVGALVAGDVDEGRRRLYEIDRVSGSLAEELRAGDGLMFLYSGAHALHLTLVWKQGGDVRTTSEQIRCERGERERRLVGWLADSDALERRDAAPVSRDASSGLRILADYDDMARFFDAKVFSPAVGLLSRAGDAVARLCVIPHRELGLLPWWQLVDRVRSVEKLTVAASWDVFRMCQRRTYPTDGPCAVLGDPTATLPSSGPEAELISTGWPGGATRWDGSLRECFARAAVLHVAAHGVFDRDDPLMSGLVLDLDQTGASLTERYLEVPGFKPASGPGKDRFRVLTVADCLGAVSLPRCRLAVLSACESGVPRIHGGGEMAGLPMALLVAGARSVIASLWPVCDPAALLMMRFLYARLAGGEASPGRALRAARDELRATTRWRARSILGPRSALPDGDLPFSHPAFADVFQCFGAW